VRQIAKDLDYRPNPLAKSLVTRQSNNIMLIVPSLGMDFRAVEQECYDNGYTLLTLSSHHNEKKIKDMLIYARQSYVDGVLLMPVGLDIPEVNKAYEEGYCVVQIEDDPNFCPGMDVFGADVKEAVRLAVNHLYNLGHRYIATVLPPLAFKPNMLRYEAWKEIMSEKGIQVRDEWFFQFEPAISSDFLQDTQIGNYKAAEEFIRRFPKESKMRPTAVITMMDTFAVPAQRAFSEAGWSIPGDISIISTASESVGSYCQVPLTTVNLNQGGTRIRALRYLLQKINGELEVNGPTRNFAKPRLVIRESTSKPKLFS
jgi:DNA-binding LacI/PurR family transcriptional regulator